MAAGGGSAALARDLPFGHAGPACQAASRRGCFRSWWIARAAGSQTAPTCGRPTVSSPL